MIVRWGIDAAPALLDELRIERPLAVASERWSGLDLGVTPVATWRDVPSERVDDAARAASDADAILAVGGGSAIDLAKAVSAATQLPLVSIPTTYSGAEWTPFFGVRDRHRRMRGGGSGARLAAIVYEPRLTLELPRATTGGTAMNALAHCAEALYVSNRSEASDRDAIAGARLIGTYLPRVLEHGRDLELRRELLAGAAHAGAALAASGLALGHAMAQAIGGRYGLPHGTLNAICLPAALRFNADVAADALVRLAAALDADDAIARVEELAALAGPTRLRELSVPEEDLEELAEATVARAGAKANPRPATAPEVAQLLRSVW